MRILLLGNLGYENDQIDGQTIKTRLVNEVLTRNIKKDDYNYFDTQQIKNKPFSSFITVIRMIFCAKKIFILPGKNGLRIVFPLVFLISVLSSKQIFYIVIGGWLPHFVKHRNFIQYMLKRIAGIYVESNSMKVQLEVLGFNNVEILYNFRKQKDVTITNSLQPFKIVFFSRVTRDKGIFDLIEAFKALNNENIQLDIYGPIDSGIQKELEELIAHYANIQYLGIIKENHYKILSQYQFMVFPTYYDGEGFPGVVIDAYMSGLPIVASNWKYNSEFVLDGKTGLLFEPKNKVEMKEKMLQLIENKSLLMQMKENALVESEKYSFTKAESFISKLLVMA